MTTSGDRPPMHRDDIERHLKDHIDRLCLDLLGEPTSRRPEELRYGRKGSLKVSLGAGNRGKWKSFEANTGGGPLQLIEFVRGISFDEALNWGRRWVGPEPSNLLSSVNSSPKTNSVDGGNDEAERLKKANALISESVAADDTLAATYLVNRGIHHRPLPDAVRFHPGTGGSQHQSDQPALLLVVSDPDGSPTAVHRVFITQDGHKVDHGLPKRTDGRLSGGMIRLPAHFGGGALILAEGVETALSIWAVTGLETWAFAGSFRDILVPLDRPVIAAVDDDPKGSAGCTARDHVLNEIRRRGADVRVATPFEPPRGNRQDFNDLLVEAGPDSVRKRIEIAEKWVGDLDIEAGLLAHLSEAEYERRRKDTAERFGIRVSVLDQEVKRRRGSVGETGGGRPIEFGEPEPWPECVEPVDVLDNIADFLERHVHMPKHAVIACTLWIAHTYVFQAFMHTPRLAITSPTKRCGKTTLTDALSRLVHRPLTASNITTAAVFRTIEIFRPTLLIDEADTYLKGNEEMRGIINSGHRRGEMVIRLVGVDYEPRAFDPFAPVSIAAIGDLPDTISDRSIRIRMERKSTGEALAPLRRSSGELAIRQKCLRFANDARGALEAIDPQIPTGLNDREADNWTPLLAIAEQAGREWPAKARDAAIALSDDLAADGVAAVGEQLLADIWRVFDEHRSDKISSQTEHRSDKISSQTLCDALADREDRPWAEWRHGNQITTRQLASLLRPFGIRPATTRSGNTTFKGYSRRQFEDGWAKYLQPDPSHRHNPQISSDVGNSASVTSGLSVTDRGRRNAPETGECDVVTDDGHEERACSPVEGEGGQATPEDEARVERDERLAIRQFDGGTSDASALTAIPEFLDRR